MTTVDSPGGRVRVVARWSLGCCGVGYVLGALVGWTGPAAVCGVLAFVALAGYVVLDERPAPPRLRRPLVAAALVLAVVTAAEGIWAASLTPEFGWFSYGSTEEAMAALDRLAEQTLARQRWWSVGMLASAVCVAVAVYALPYRRRPRPAIAATAVSLLLLGVVLVDVVDSASRRPGSVVLAAVWLPLLAATVALAAAVLAAQRAGTGWLASAGAALLAVPPLAAAPMAAWTVSWPSGGTEVVQSISVVETAAVSVAVSSADPFAAVVAAAMFAGPVLVAVDCLRAGAGESAGPTPATDSPSE